MTQLPKPLPSRSPAPAMSPLEPLLSSRIIVAGNLLRRGANARYRRLLDLQPVEYGIVGVLGRRAPIMVIDLADLLGMDKAQLSRALGRLEARRLVLRHVDASDRRVSRIALSSEGLALHETIVATAKAVNARLVSDIKPAEMAIFDKVLTLITQRASDLLRAERPLGEDDDAA